MAKWIKFKVTEREYRWLYAEKKKSGLNWRKFILTKVRGADEK